VNNGDTPCGYCSGNVELYNSYQSISGMHPTNPNRDTSTRAVISLTFNCQVVGEGAPDSVVIYADDITLTIEAILVSIGDRKSRVLVKGPIMGSKFGIDSNVNSRASS
jgi:hypothetical protein